MCLDERKSVEIDPAKEESGLDLFSTDFGHFSGVMSNVGKVHGVMSTGE